MTAAELWEAANRCVTAEDCRTVRSKVMTAGLQPEVRSRIIEYLMDLTADIAAAGPESEREHVMEDFSKD